MPTMSISRAITHHATERPHDPSLTCGDTTLSWLELDRRTNRLARAFAALGVEADDLSWSTADRLRDAVDATVVATTAVVEDLREHKDTDEIERIRDAAAMADAALDGVRPLLLTELTERELEVLRLVALFRTNDEIAGQLEVTLKTVEYHLANILVKLGKTSRREAARWAWDQEIVVL